jgi:hypothetical protein
VFTRAEADYQRWPLFWFARLESALELGDHQAAATAHRHLARLGVDVRYRATNRIGQKNRNGEQGTAVSDCTEAATA